MADAFKAMELEHMINVLKKMFYKMTAHHAADLRLTHEDVLQLFAPAEHHALLRSAPSVMACHVRTAFSVDWESRPGGRVFSPMNIYITLIGPNPPGMPIYPTVQWGACPELLNRVNAWLAQQMDIRFDFGRVRNVLKKLDELCRSPKQVRYLWPAVQFLIGDNDKLRAKLAPAKAVPDTPSLREGMRRATATLASIQLLTDPPEDVTNSVTITIATELARNEGFGAFSMFHT